MTNRRWDENHPEYWLDEEEFLGEQPHAEPKYWSERPYWTPEEGVALLLGYDPRIVNLGLLKHSDHPFAQTYADIRDLALRARDIGKLSDTNVPIDFIKWARSQGHSFSPEVEQAVINTSKAKRIANRSSDDGLNPKVKQSWQKMILGMAIAGYGYDPKKGRSSVPREICDDLVRLGLPLSEDTARDHLTDAARELSDQLVSGSDRS